MTKEKKKKVNKLKEIENELDHVKKAVTSIIVSHKRLHAILRELKNEKD